MVGSYMGLLARRYQGKLDESADRYIQFAVEGASRMQALIADLLTYSRAGTQAIEKKPTPFQRIVETALSNLEVAIRESGAQIRCGNLPTVEADETKLVQVVQNLIGNAIKFRKPDVTPAVEITASQVDSRWLFSVADNGIGFEPKYTDRIFQVFQRLHTVGRYPGNGIGLAISRRIIEHHGGELWADSQPEVGSTFFFTLPIATESSVPQSDWSRSEGNDSTKPSEHVGTSSTV
jgi:light-regulated signal transduction histidine kinase (bacteriophytochrome)